MKLGLLMIASRSCRLRASFCATVSSPAAAIGLRNWISSVASSPESVEASSSIGLPDAQAKVSSSIGNSLDYQSRASNVQAKAVKKRMMFKKLSNLSETEGTVGVEETLVLFRTEDANAFDNSDLVRWAKLLHKKGKIYHAAEIFGWMHKNNVPFSPSQTAFYVDLLIKTKGSRAAEYYYWRIPYKQRSHAAYNTLMKGYNRELEDPFKLKLQRDTPIPPPLRADEDRNAILEKAVQAYMDRIGFPQEKKRPLSKRKTREFYKMLEEFPCVAM